MTVVCLETPSTKDFPLCLANFTLATLDMPFPCVALFHIEAFAIISRSETNVSYFNFADFKLSHRNGKGSD